jgi:hypothetical protein
MRRWLVLGALIGLTALAFAYGPGWPDVSRLGLTQSVALDGTLRIDRYAAQTRDRARYGGHWYSDKAPGISFLALPTFEVMRGLQVVDRNDEQRGIWHERGLLMAARILTGGLAFLCCVFLVARAAEQLRPGTGVVTGATFGLGTMALPLAATTHGHLAAGGLALAAFLAARRRAATLAGALAGTAVLFEYQAAVLAAIVASFLAARARAFRPPILFVLGAVVPLGLLAAYDTAAFGAPQHLSYRYFAGGFGRQHEHFFGIGLAGPHTIATVLFGNRGLLVFSPILVLAAAGIVLLGRRGLKGEAAVSGAAALLFVLLDAGNWDPLGGVSPGPRYIAPVLPFLALGLPEAYARWPRPTAIVGLASVGGMLYQAGTYGPNFDFSTVWWWLGLPRAVGFVLVLLPCVGALALAAQALRANAISVSDPAG